MDQDRTGFTETKQSEQSLQNYSYDREFNVFAYEGLGYTGQGLQRSIGESLAVKITTSGSITYVALAAPGTALSSALWQCRKIDESSGVLITWADGNANFDNIATDLTTLNYS